MHLAAWLLGLVGVEVELDDRELLDLLLDELDLVRRGRQGVVRRGRHGVVRRGSRGPTCSSRSPSAYTRIDRASSSVSAAASSLPCW